MSYRVWLQDVRQQYYAYVKHALYQDADNQPLWMFNHDEAAFEERWFTQQGITRIKSVQDDKDICGLQFESEEHFTFWMMRWT